MGGHIMSRTLTAAAVCLSFGPAMAGAQSSGAVARPTVDGSIYGHIVQVGWVVKDLDPVVDYWQKLGLKDIQRDGVRDFPNVNYRGKIINLKMKMAFGDIGGVQIEWIQPVGPKSVYDEFLAKHGDGVHHLAYQMPSPAVMDQQIQYFKQRGVKVIQSGTWKGQKGEGRFAYLDTAPEGGGITLELIYHPDWPLGGEQPHRAGFQRRGAGVREARARVVESEQRREPQRRHRQRVAEPDEVLERIRVPANGRGAVGAGSNVLKHRAWAREG